MPNAIERAYTVKIVSIEERFMPAGYEKDDEGKRHALKQSIGFFAVLDPGYMSVFVGKERPTDLKPGQFGELVLRVL